MDLHRDHSQGKPLDYGKDIRQLYKMEKITRLSPKVSEKSKWAEIPTTAREANVYSIQFPFHACLRQIEKHKPKDQIKICDFACGISDFGMKMRKRGYQVFSVDPIYEIYNSPDSEFKPSFYETIDGEFGMMLTRKSV